LIVVDIPFGYYQSNSDIALASAIKIMKESGAHTVKLEGGAEIIDAVKIVRCRRSRYGTFRANTAVHQ
jgi:3-methyl-2-oxobutanoate hydroxymethyltransferase